MAGLPSNFSDGERTIAIDALSQAAKALCAVIYIQNRPSRPAGPLPCLTPFAGARTAPYALAEDGAGLGRKYDEYGARCPMDIAGSAMPMQKIEAVDMPEAGLWPWIARNAIAESWFAPQAFSGNR